MEIQRLRWICWQHLEPIRVHTSIDGGRKMRRRRIACGTRWSQEAIRSTARMDPGMVRSIQGRLDRDQAPIADLLLRPAAPAVAAYDKPRPHRSARSRWRHNDLPGLSG